MLFTSAPLDKNNLKIHPTLSFEAKSCTYWCLWSPLPIHLCFSNVVVVQAQWKANMGDAVIPTRVSEKTTWLDKFIKLFAPVVEVPAVMSSAAYPRRNSTSMGSACRGPIDRWASVHFLKPLRRQSWAQTVAPECLLRIQDYSLPKSKDWLCWCSGSRIDIHLHQWSIASNSVSPGQNSQSQIEMFSSWSFWT